MELSDKKILVCGNGLSGQAVFSKSTALGGKPEYYDGGRIKERKYDLAVLSPFFSKRSDLYFDLISLGIPVLSEIDFAYLTEPRRIIAVTGTNGKTTTVELVEGMLKKAGVDAVAAGNIGVPLTKSGRAEVTVCEVSSFMLEQSSFFRADYSAITNVAPDHLDRHVTFGEYARCKKKLFSLTLFGVAIAKEKESEYAVNERLKKICYSKNGGDVHVCDDAFYYKGERLVDLKDVSIKGERNVENILTALSLCILYRGFDHRYADFLKEYVGAPYRMAYRGNIGGKEVYNDSKGTNVAATLAAINDLKGSVVLLLGGYGKGEDYEELFEGAKDRKITYCIYGKNKREIAEVAEKRKANYKIFQDLDSATDYAFKSEGENLLFSPTTSSFDAFSSFTERGKYFDELLEKYKL